MDDFPTELRQHWRAEGSWLAYEAQQVRNDIVNALFESGGGHYGGSLSVVDILVVLYRTQLRISPSSPSHSKRDRIVLSKGHSAIALYAVLRRLGYFSDRLSGYGAYDSRLQGHPDAMVPGVEFSTGSLGQGLSLGIGMAIATGNVSQVWVVLGDGECQEGQVWEAAMLATRYQVGNVYAVVDANGHQEYGWHDDPRASTESRQELAEKWRAFGWRVFSVDGHDLNQLQETFSEMTNEPGPAVAIASTRKGKGVGLIEDDPHRFHCTSVTAEEHAEILEALE